MNEKPQILILIVNWRNYPDTKACLESLPLLTYENYQVMVVDNGSGDDSIRSMGEDFPEVKLVELDENLGFAGGNNVGLEYALENDFPYVLLLNNDTTILDGDFLSKLVQVLEREHEIGAIGPAVQQTNGQTQLSILPYPSLGNTIKNSLGLYDPEHKNRQFVDSVAGCCVLVRREAIQIAGLLDDNYFMYGEETEWFFRMRKNGWKVLYLPIKSIIHKGAASIEMLEQQDIYVECRANLIYTLVKHNQKMQAVLTLPLMTILLLLRSALSVFRTGDSYPLSMILDLWRNTLIKWNLAKSAK